MAAGVAAMRKAGGGNAGLKVVFFSSIFSNLLPLFSSPSVLAFYFFFFFVSVTSPLVCHFFVITPRSSPFFCFLLVLSSSSFQFVHSSRSVFFFFASVFLFFHSTLRPFSSLLQNPLPPVFFSCFHINLCSSLKLSPASFSLFCSPLKNSPCSYLSLCQKSPPLICHLLLSFSKIFAPFLSCNLPLYL